MPKRTWAQQAIDGPLAKRPKPACIDRLSILSDELLLRLLSYLSMSELLLCERISRRFRLLAKDPQLWKAFFYDRFVRPRASRIPGIRDAPQSLQALFFSSKVARWLEDEHLVRNGVSTDWKRQYRIRHNWSRGSARVSETQVAHRPSVMPLLLRLHSNTVITVDVAHGLRAWSLKDGRGLTATQSIGAVAPTCLAIEPSTTETNGVDIAVGFADGKFSIHSLVEDATAFVVRFIHPAPSKRSGKANNSLANPISAIAYVKPYLLTMTPDSSLSLYHFHENPGESPTIPMRAPILLSSLKSHSAWPPSSLSIRVSTASVVASIAYAVPTWNLKWSVGLQEIRLDMNGSLLDSRVASASTTFTARSVLESQSASDMRKATSLSYNHPYLLTSHPDNTLTLYMVNSTTDELVIGPGTRLWGHTSSISGAHVGDRGKAVSVSTSGDELRVWQLEGVTPKPRSRRQQFPVSVQVLPGPQKNVVDDDSLALMRNRRLDESLIAPGWLAFDEEKVVLLQERTQGPQALVMYDFN